MRHSPQFVMERDPTAFYCIVRQQCAYSSAHRLTPLFTTASDSAETPRRPAGAGAPPGKKGGNLPGSRTKRGGLGTEIFEQSRKVRGLGRS